MANTSSPTLLGNRLPFNLSLSQSLSGSWSQISTDNDFAVALSSNGLLYAWGVNTSSQVGDGTTLNKSTPVQISTSSFSVISAGWDHSGAIDVNNNLYVWGNSSSILAPTVNYSWKKISYGFTHALAIRNDDTLWAWGQNSAGQLGDNSTINKSSPVQIGTGSWTEVSAGVSHSLALRSDNILFTWGLNSNGQLGDFTTLNKSSPVQIGTSSWIAISAGGSFSVAIRLDNIIYNWGSNANYQLGDLTTLSKSSPVQLGTTSWSLISAGISHTAAITTTGLLYVWGASSTLPDPIPTTIYSWTNIGGGTSVSGAVRSDGKLYVWGENTSGQLGQIIDLYRRSSPVLIASSNYTQILVSSFTQVGYGDAHGVALTTDGQIYTWGLGTSGQLGNNSAVNRSSPVPIPSTGTSFYQQIAAGKNATYAITKSSATPAYTLYGWGAGTLGELAQITNAAFRSNPVLIASGTSFSKVSAGNGFAAGLTTDNRLFVWGLGTSGQMGELAQITKSSPVQVSGSWIDVGAGTEHIIAVRSDNTLWVWGGSSAIGLMVEPQFWTNVSMGLSHAVAITSGGSLYTWGLNSLGQLGQNNIVSRSSPTQVNLSSYVFVSAKGNTTYAIRADNNSLWGWGLNSSGQIGNNSTIDRSSPVQVVASLSSYSQVAAGVDHVLVITSSNELYSWGRNTAGQLGTNNQGPTGDTINRSTPVTVNIFSPLQISAGNSFSTSIDSAGKLYAWGLNTSGQLGDKSIINKSAPVQIGTSNWTKVSSGFDHNLAIRSDGTLWTWGNAAAINLVVEAESWSQIAYGTDHTLAIRSDGALFTWGKNDVGQLGLSDNLNRSSPTMVTSLNFTSWSIVSAGNSYSLGITGGLVYTWGLNSSGQLGDLSTINKSNPTLVNAPPTRLLTLQNTTLIDNSNYNATITPGAVSSRYPYPAYNIGSYTGYATAFNTLQFSTVTRGTAGNAGANSTTNGIDGMIWLNFPYSYGVTNSSATILSSISPAISGKTSWTLNDGAITLNSYGTTTFTCDSNVTVPIVVWGAGGGTTTNTIGNGGNGGAGGLTYAFVNLVAGTSYRAIVGQGGISASVASQVAAGGGGGSGIEISNTSNPIIVAGGGGGGGASNSGGFGYDAGGGGGTDGQRNTVILFNGYGGSQAAAGAGAIGNNGNNGENGLNRNGGRGARVGGVGGGSAGGAGFGNGGEGGSGSNGAAGGGGGGYYGGGGGGYGDTLGPGGSGGGGSGYLNTNFVSNSITIQSNLYTVATVASSFDGYAIVPYNNGFDIPAATNWTFECYIYLTALPTNPNQYVIAGRNWNYGTSGPTWGFNILSTGVLQWSYASTGVATNVLAQTGTGVITTGSWIHLAFVKNTSNLASIYVNGTLSTSRTDTNAMTSSSGDLYIGKASNLNSASQFTGHISDVRIVYGTAVYTGNFTVPTRTLSVSQSAGTNISAITAGTSFEFAEAGFAHVIGYTSSKTTYVWGQNNAGQLGTNNIINRSSPTTLASPWDTSSFVAVSAGESFTTAIDSLGKLWTWGLNTSGQLGLTVTDLISRSSPVQIGYNNYFSWIKVSSGSTHSLGITTNNILYTWGQSTAVILPVTVFSWSQLATGIQSSHNAAIRSDGMLFVWGFNNVGQIGDNTLVSKSSPVQIGTTIWSSVALGKDFTLAKTAAGTVFAWGNNASGQLGIGDTTNRASPVLVSASSYTQISAGSDHSFAIKSDGTALAWGLNTSGELGIGTAANRSNLVTIPSISFAIISAGSSFTTGIDTLGRLYAWGLNNAYQLGDAIAASINRSTPTLVPLPTVLSFSNVSSGADHTLALDSNTKLWTWGNPLAVGVNVNSWTQVSVGAVHSLALRSDGRMFTWGDNSQGQLGQLNINSRSFPVPVGSSSWTTIAAGYLMSAAIRSDGTLWTWGYNAFGQLGQVTATATGGDTINRSSPTQVSGAVSIGSTLWTQVTAGQNFTAGINNGRAYVWGINTSGQLGNNSTLNRSSPVQTGSISNYSQISAGLNFITATTQSYTMYAWGSNTLNQLGDNTSVNKSNPIQIGFDNSWLQIASGYNHSLAINFQNKLYTWGNQNAINLVPPLQSWTAISSGVGSHTVAIRSDGLAYAWGLNSSGQLGDGTTVNRNSPILVSASRFISVAAGSNYSLAVASDYSLYGWGLNASGQLGDNTVINKSVPTQIGYAVQDSSVYKTPLTCSSGVSYTTTVIPFVGSISVQFGLTDNLTMAFNPYYAQGLLSFGTGNFTVECWVYPTIVNASFAGIIDARAVAAAQSWIFYLNTVGGVYKPLFYIAGTSYQGATTISLNTWTHLVYVRQSGTLSLYVAGTLDTSWASVTTAVDAAGTTPLIGQLTNGNGGFVGYLSNLRVVRSVAVYTGNFTVPTSVLTTSQASGTNISAIETNQTSLLTFTTLANTINFGNYLSVSAGASHSAVIDNTGKLYIWGASAGGALGDGQTAINRSSPILIGNSSWSIVALGNSFTTAITSTGKLFTWGLNTLNQLGDATSISKSSPVQIGDGLSLSFIKVGAGNDHAAAITTNYKLYAWGSANGVLLQNSTQSWTKLSAGMQHTVAIRSDGLLYVWGLNNAGQLGDSTTINKSSPVLISSDSSWSAVSAGDSFTLAVRNNGLLYTWGLNDVGQLGDRSVVNKSSPSVVGTFDVVDASNVPNTITRTGSLMFDTVNIPFANAVSMNFPTFTQFLQPVAQTPLSLGTGDFTVEAWINIQTLSPAGNVNSIIDSRASTGATPWAFLLRQLGSTQILNLEFYTGTQYTGKLAIPYNVWVHVAATRASNTLSLWVNGILDYSFAGVTTNLNIASTSQYIGRLVDNTNFATAGNISNLRVVKGIAVYTGVFTVPTSPLTATQIAGTNIAAISGNETSLLVLNTPAASITGSTTFSNVFAGSSHSLAIASDNKLYAWGQNNAGQIGNNTTLNRSSPTLIGTSSWTTVSAGASYSVGITSTGRLFGWGLNNNNQIGDGTTTPKSNPVLVGGDANLNQINTSFTAVSAGLDHNLAITSNNNLWTWGNASAVILTRLQGVTSWTKMAAGASHTLAIRSDGMLFAWGLNTSGQLGDGTAVTKSSPTIIGNFSWNAVGAGQSHSFAIRSDGILFAWGLGTSGQLGDVTSSVTRSSPVQIGTSSWTSVSGGNIHSAGIDILGRLYTWGAAAGGQTGQNNTTTLLSPVQLGSNSWTSVSTGTSHTVALRNDSTMWAWGINTSNQVGDGTGITRSSPVQIGVGSSWSAISSEFDHNLALNSSNKLYVWGPAASVLLPTGPLSWTQIANGSFNRVAIREDGSLWAWGNGGNGAIGDGTTISKSSPVLISADWSWNAVAAGQHVCYAIRGDGGLFAWGLGLNGILGNNGTDRRSSPVQIGTSSWVSISASTNNFAIAKRADGTIWTWGLNGSGQLGDNTTITKSSPVQVGSSSWKQVEAGAGSIVVGIFNDDTLYVWGNNFQGNLGLNDTIDRSNPVQLGTESYILVSGGGAGIRTNNTLFVWGPNATGKLGQGNAVTRSSPVQIAGSWSQVNNNSRFFGIRTDGTLWSAGNNNQGQLGDGTTISKSSPVQITGSWTAINVGYDPGASISNIMYFWGQNQSVGTFGFGDTIDRSSPVILGSTNINITTPYIIPTKIGNSSWTAVNAGTSYSLAILSNNNVFAWGLGTSGQLGDNSTISKSSPVLVANGAASFIMAGGAHGFAWSNTANFRPFGLNNAGQLGVNDTVNRSSAAVIFLTGIETQFGVPTRINNTLSWTSVSAGQSFSLATPTTGALYAWGVNSLFQLGDNTSVGATRSSPTIVAPGNSWTVIAAGKSHSVALRNTDSTLFAWGSSVSGQIGDNAAINRSSPTQLASTALNTSVPVPTKVGDSSWTQVVAGTSFTMAIRSDSTLWAWGKNDVGQLGNNVPAVNRSSPVQVSGVGTSSYTQLGASASNAFAIQSSNLLYGWGLGTWIGDSIGATRSAPTIISPISVAAGQWPVPTLFDSPNNYSKVIAGNSMSLAIRSNSQLYAWGLNNLGQLGDNTTITKSSPVQIGSTTELGSWIAIGAGQNDLDSNANPIYAITSRYSMYGWGTRSTNGIGDNSTVAKSSPVQVPASSADFGTAVISKLPMFIDTSFSQISAGTSHSLVRKSNDNTVFAWGINNAGQFLDNTVTSASVPVIVGQSPIVTDVSQAVLTVTTPFGQPKSTYTSPFANDPYDVSIYGGSLYFDGTSRALIAADSTLNIFNSFFASSMEIWIKSTVSGRVQIILAQDDATNTGQIFQLLVNTTNFLVFTYFTTIARASAVTLTSTNQINSNNWNHVLVTYSGTGASLGPELRVFLNGVLEIYQLNAFIYAVTPRATGIGSFNSSILSPFNGFLTNLRITLGIPTTYNTNSTTIGATIFTVPTSPLTSTSQGAISSNVLFLGLRNIPTYVTVSNISAQHSTTSIIDNSNNTLINGGFNNVGQLGNGDKLNRSGPVILGNAFIGINTGTQFPLPIVSTSSFTQVHAGTSFSVAVDSTRRLFTWGLNTNGQLGDNSTITKSSPVQVALSANLVSAYANNTAYIDFFSNKLYTWGLNSSWQVGDFSSINKSSPILVGNNQALNSFTNSPVQVRVGFSNFTQIAAGLSYSIAVDSNNNVYGWGLNSIGQLGLSNTINRSIATQIASGTPISNTTAGTATILTDTTNRIYSFGFGLSGSIGTQEAINRSAPVMIGNSNHINTGTLAPVQVQFQLPSSWVAVAAGFSHSLAKISSGQIYAFGRGLEGQLGNNGIINRSAPVLVGNSFNLITAGDYHSLAIKSDGTMYNWGLNNVGQVGNDSVTIMSSPTLIGGQINTMTASPIQVTGSWNSVSVGSSHTLAINSSNLLYSWGLNNYGQLGDNSTITKSSIVQVTAVGAQFVDTSISKLSLYPTGPGAQMILVSPFAGGSYDPAIYGASGSFNGTDFVITEGNFNNFNYYNSEFTVEAWIYTNTLVGVRSIIDSWYVPYQILLRTNGALLEAYLATNPSTGTAITVNYTLPATGTWYHVAVVRRYDSQRTIPSLVLELYVDGISRGTPVYNDTNLPGWFDWYYRIGVSWNGYISNVRIVKGTAVYTSNFTPPVLPLSNIAGTVLLTCQEWDTTNTFTSVSAGSSFSIAKLTNGRIYGWGLNNLNQIGNYAAQWRSVPSLINSGSWSQIAAGQSTGFGIKDNLLYGWGQNNLGQLGDNTVTNKAFPNIVQGINLATRSPTLVGSNFQTVSAGTSTTSAISNNSLFVWGLGTTGQIGIMSAVTRSSPTQVIGSWNKVFVGNSTLFAINTSNKLYAWGLGTNGQTAGYMTVLTTSSPNTIGNNYLGTVNQSSPALLDSGSWIAITAGNLWSAAIRSDGALFTWGNRTDGTLGDGLTIARSMMMQIGTRSYTQVAGQQSHGAALSTIGELYAWGLNSAGQLGITSVSPSGDVIQRSSITLVGSNYVQISAGISYTAAIRNNGQLFAWGLGTSGELGYGTAASRSSPVAVAGNLSWSSLNAGYLTAGAITTTGLLYNWGASANAQLAPIWTIINRSLPTQVGNVYAALNVNTRVPFKVSDASWIGMDAGYYNSIGIQDNNKLYTWGFNTVGRLGINNTLDRSSPTVVGNYTYLSNTVSVGAFNTAVIGKGTFGDPTGGY